MISAKQHAARCLAVSLLIASSLFQVADAALAVGDTICVEGFVMDFFCINRGTLLDKSSVRTLEGPDQHSIHCLVDVRSCVNSPYEILLEPKEGEILYSRGWQLDEDSKQMAIELAQSVSTCTTCDPLNNRDNSHAQGFRAAMTATILNLNEDETIPPTIRVQDMVDTTAYSASANGGQSACTVFLGVEDILETDGAEAILEDIIVAGDAATQSGLSLRQIHLIHGSLMMVSWGFLLPSGTLIAKFYKHRPDGLWFKLHRGIQMLGLLLAIIGWIIALVNFTVFQDVGFRNYQHGICGMVVMILGILQPLNALLRPHAPKSDDEPKTTKRHYWEIWHKISGYSAVLLAVPTIVLGSLSLPNLDDQTKVQIGYGVGCIGGLLVLVSYMFYDKHNYQQAEQENNSKTPEEATQDATA